MVTNQRLRGLGIESAAPNLILCKREDVAYNVINLSVNITLMKRPSVLMETERGIGERGLGKEERRRKSERVNNEINE